MSLKAYYIFMSFDLIIKMYIKKKTVSFNNLTNRSSNIAVESMHSIVGKLHT